MENLRKKINSIIREAVFKKKPFETYFDSYSAAVQHARAIALERGYVINDDDWFTYVNNGPRKPVPGETTPMINIPLYDVNDKLMRVMLHYRVYGMDGGNQKYELTAYIG